MTGAFERVYEIVSAIPRGKVLTYGLISNIMEGRISAQGVGWAMQALGKKEGKEKKTIPWHRVVSGKGTLSTHKNPDIAPGEQKRLLLREGVRFDDEDRIDLDKYLWLDGLSQFMHDES
ncbi:MAG: MGMT family protein [Candidatus Obscuribacterales bacterium]|nr:MGMT family protein [Candidatus Obscuribacterales bacterium]